MAAALHATWWVARRDISPRLLNPLSEKWQVAPPQLLQCLTQVTIFALILSRTPCIQLVCPPPPHIRLNPSWAMSLAGTILASSMQAISVTTVVETTQGITRCPKSTLAENTVTTLEPLVSPDAKKTMVTNMNNGSKRPAQQGTKPRQQLKTTVSTGVPPPTKLLTPLPTLNIMVTETTRVTVKKQAFRNPMTTHSLSCPNYPPPNGPFPKPPSRLPLVRRQEWNNRNIPRPTPTAANHNHNWADKCPITVGP